MACRHTRLEVMTEKDRCHWVRCTEKGCRKRGPKKNTRFAAVVAFAVGLIDQHPRK